MIFFFISVVTTQIDVGKEVRYTFILIPNIVAQYIIYNHIHVYEIHLFKLMTAKQEIFDY